MGDHDRAAKPSLAPKRHNFSALQVASFRKEFDAFDVDGDGFLVTPESQDGARP